MGTFIDEKRDLQTIDQIRQVLSILTAAAKRLDLEPSYIGVGLAGLVDPKTGVLEVSPAIPELEGKNLENEIASFAALPVTLNNDANAYGYAEWRFGAGIGTKSCVTLVIGTGIGGAIVLDSSLLVGEDRVAGEIGHMILSHDGPSCRCGGRGCLEQLASGTAIINSIVQRIKSGEETTLRERFVIDQRISGEEAAKAAFEGDKVALSAYEMAGRWLGIAIATVANLLNMDVVVLGGGVMNAGELLMPHILRNKDLYTMPIQRRRLRIMRGQLERKAGVIGAASLAFDSLKIMN